FDEAAGIIPQILSQAYPRRRLVQPRCVSWRGAVAVLALLASGGLAGAADPPARKDPPRPLPEDLVAAWEKAGAPVGWLRVEAGDEIGWRPAKEGRAGDLPAVWVVTWKAGGLAKLPAPATAVGLSLGDGKVTDAGLKELAGLTTLQALDLGRTPVTGPGLKELAGLNGLQWLNLSGAKVTGAGLKELAGLKNLHTLNLSSTPMTEAGMKE